MSLSSPLRWQHPSVVALAPCGRPRARQFVSCESASLCVVLRLRVCRCAASALFMFDQWENYVTFRVLMSYWVNNCAVYHNVLCFLWAVCFVVSNPIKWFSYLIVVRNSDISFCSCLCGWTLSCFVVVVLCSHEHPLCVRSVWPTTCSPPLRAPPLPATYYLRYQLVVIVM